MMLLRGLPVMFVMLLALSTRAQTVISGLPSVVLEAAWRKSLSTLAAGQSSGSSSRINV